MYKKNQHIHFVGIGGIGMSGIAELLLNLSYRVSGSDMKETEITRRLSSLGASIYYGHDKKNLKDVDVVVVSSAVKQDNPEVVCAHENSIPVIPRAEMLSELMRLKYGIAVAGAHGKTTTTSLIAAVLEHGGIDPTVVIGGKLIKTNTNAFLGSGDFLVAEADESDGSFLKLPPTIAVVTNIDREHMDYYKSMKKIIKTFLEFINKVPFYGLAIICLDDENLQNLIPEIEKRFFTYGCTAQADLQAQNITFEGFTTTFNVIHHETCLGDIVMNMPGIHNVYNALAAIAVGLELNLEFSNMKHALQEFKGIQRRLQLRSKKSDISWIDDYAHHPTEIRMTLKAVKQISGKRVVTIFQPHRYSRTKDLFHEFVTSFYDADVVIITDIYPAGEQPIPEINGQTFYEGIKKHGHKDVVFIPDMKEVENHLSGLLKAGDVLLTLGAGDIWHAGENIMKNLGQ